MTKKKFQKEEAKTATAARDLQRKISAQAQGDLQVAAEDLLDAAGHDEQPRHGDSRGVDRHVLHNGQGALRLDALLHVCSRGGRQAGRQGRGWRGV